jgi:insulysin
MHRFAQFFIKPLMSPDAVLREIKAVDSGKQLFYAWLLFV